MEGRLLSRPQTKSTTAPVDRRPPSRNTWRVGFHPDHWRAAFHGVRNSGNRFHPVPYRPAWKRALHRAINGGSGSTPTLGRNVLVVNDMLSLTEVPPKFVKRYADLRDAMGRTIADFRSDDKRGDFPGPDQIYS
ncbi:MAG: 3-methyl-2-oxobutanoate hydroxymethyltransferase [Caldilineales bacterium]|nr:3-methyl-2-oxobutanoate hydroxymethyltransferase [Caldilineales bacterium]